jgi:hypothetical protein
MTMDASVSKIRICAVVSGILLIAQILHAAHFEHYAGGFEGFEKVFTQDADYYDGPWEKTDSDVSSVYSEEYAEVPSAYSYAYNTIWDINEPSLNSVSIRFESYADANASDSFSDGYAYGRCSTQVGNELGKYYTIEGDSGEAVGDDVIVFCTSQFNVVGGGTSFGYLGGPGAMDHMAVTRGQLPIVTGSPDPANEVWTRDNVELVDEDYASFSKTAMFAAKVGDVIGVFAENYTDVTLEESAGPGDGWLLSEFSIILSVTVPLQGDIDLDGDVDAYDFAKFANNWLIGA